MEIRETPTAEAGMLIRRPVGEVFEAIVDPVITTKFWFTHGSGRLDSGKQVRWKWRMYDVSTAVDVSEIVKDRKIVMQWSDPPTTVVWTFTEMPGKATFIEVRNFGFAGSGDEQVKEAVGSTGGLTVGLIGDRHPKGLHSSS
ncbi:MAG: polyketide cyclase [Mesorhizobium sp.]|nr:MAG: polyketide cyclase [Mesorhizobium sp.]